jgi:hypothetical protein
MLRSRTQKKITKKTTPLSIDTSPVLNQSEIPAIIGNIQHTDISKKEISTESMLSALHNAELKISKQRPWLRIDRGIRIKLLRAFTEKKTDLTVAERDEMLKFLIEALDNRSLNSKSQITYLPEINEITEIQALKTIKTEAGKTIFRIETPNKTKKAKRLTNSDEE